MPQDDMIPRGDSGIGAFADGADLLAAAISPRKEASRMQVTFLSDVACTLHITGFTTAEGGYNDGAAITADSLYTAIIEVRGDMTLNWKVRGGAPTVARLLVSEVV